MYTASFSIHAVNLNFISNSPIIADSIRRFLNYFQCETLERSDLEIALHAIEAREQLPTLPGCPNERLFEHHGKTAGDALREEWKCSLYKIGGQLIADFHEQGRLCIDYTRGRVEGHLIRPDAMHPDVYATYFHLALSELLKRAGLYAIHATALAKNGHGVLIPGASGRGKTTCCISLLRGGYRYLSDDHPLIREDKRGIELLCFPEKIDVTDHTIEFFPELKKATRDLEWGIQKRYFYVDEFYPNAIINTCRPSLIIIPDIGDGARSRLVPLPKNRVLEELLLQGLLVFDKEIAGRQFETFCRLVDGVDCYRLSFGRDVLELPRLIDSILGG
jgi:hypothetical protein